MDQLAVVLSIFIGLFIWASIGHVLWLLGRAFIRLLVGKKEEAVVPRDVTVAQLEKDVRQLYLQGSISQEQLTHISKAISPVDPSKADESVEPEPELPGTVEALEPVVAEIVDEDESDDLEIVSSTPPPVSELSVEDRAKIYAQRRQEAAVETATAIEVGERVPSAQKRSTSEWLNAFLESANIRWGELVGGLLIVSCSTALVISFWGEISSRPLLKFGVFNTVLGLLFAVGIYAHHRWKLPSTSQGILTIALHLVPLNFLAIAAFTQSAPPTSWTILGELISIGILSVLGFFAAQILTPRWSIETTIVATLLPVAQLLIRRWIGADSSATQIAAMLGAVIGAYAVSLFAVLWKLHRTLPGRTDNSDESILNEFPKAVAQSWLALGIGSFAIALCIAFLIIRTENVSKSLSQLSIFVGVLAAPAMSIGSTIWKRSSVLGKTWVSLSSSAVTVASVMVLCVGVAFAWPNPFLMSLACLIVVVCVSVLAGAIDAAELHYLAMPFLWGLALLGNALFFGDLAFDSESSLVLLRALISHATGVYTIVACVFAMMLGTLLHKLGQPEHALVYLRGTLGLAGLALVFALWFGLGREGDATRLLWILSVYAVASCVSAFVFHEEKILWGTSILLAVLCCQAMIFSYPVHEYVLLRILFAALTYASLTSILSVISKSWNPSLAFPLQSSTTMGSIFSAMLLIVCAATAYSQLSAWYIGWMALNWFVLSLVSLSAGPFMCFQAASFFACVIAINQWQATRDWNLSGPLNWLHPFSVQAQVTLCGLFFLIWWLFRFGLVKWTKYGEGRYSFLLTKQIDFVVLYSGVVFLLLIAASSVVPGAAQELHLMDATDFDRAAIATDQFWQLRIPYTTPRNLLVWCSLAAIGSATLCGVRQRYEHRMAVWVSIAGVIVAMFSAALLVSAFAERSVAVASAIRWIMSLFFGVSAIVIWTSHRRIATLCTDQSPLLEIGDKEVTRFCFWSILLLSVLPIALMIIYIVDSAFAQTPPAPMEWTWMLVSLAAGGLFFAISVIWKSTRTASWLSVLSIIGLIGFVAFLLLTTIRAISDHPILGPHADSIFRRMGFLASYVIPVAIYTGAFIGFAHFFRSGRLALVAGILVNVCGTATFLFLRKASLLTSPTLFLHLSELNAILAALGALVWFRWLTWMEMDHQERGSTSFKVQMGIAIGFLVIPLTSIAAVLLLDPTTALPLDSIAGYWGWISLALVVFCVWHCTEPTRRSNVWLALNTLMASSVWIACESNRLAAAWTSYHVLLGSWAILAPAMIVIDYWLSKKQERAISFLSLHVFAIFVVVAYSLRCLAGDPDALYWSVGGLISAALSGLLLAFLSNRAMLFAQSVLLCNLLGSVWWIQISGGFSTLRSLLEWLADLGRMNVIAVSIPILIWSMARASHVDEAIEKRVRRVFVIFRLLAIWGLCFLSLATTLLGFVFRRSLNTTPLVAWASVLFCTLAVLSGLRWRRPGRVGVLAYLAGFCSVGIFLESLQIQGDLFIWSSCLALSAYGMLASYLATCGKQFEGLVKRLGLRQADPSFEQIKVLAIFVALGVIVLGFWTLFSCPIFAMRLAAAHGVLAQALAMAFLSRGKRVGELRFFALALGAIAAVAVGWSPFPEGQVLLLDRTVRFAVSMIVVSFVYSFAFAKWLNKENPWSISALRCIPVTVACMFGSMVFALVIESTAFFQDRSIEISAGSILALSTIFGAAIVMCMVFAIWPARNPLRLSTQQLGWYVYAAELFAVMLAIHLRLSMPWLFQGIFERVWPLLVVGIAFLGVALSEIFTRLKRPEIATPFENTGALLPMLPAFGYSFAPSSINFSLLMFTICGLYAVLCSLRKSILFGALATVAGNVGLWHFIYQRGIFIDQHPQVWLIPPAVCLLIASSMNRDRLSKSQFVAIRYFAASMIYVSSTADIFINGVAEAPWLPVVLAGISILGIFLGIMFRVRAFLFLGISFLLVSMLTVVWHAAVDMKQTWLWYVCGIAAGMLILAIFAVFEKKRQRVLDMMRRMQDWDA